MDRLDMNFCILNRKNTGVFMKEIQYQFNKKMYYGVMTIIILGMISGLILDNPRFGEFSLGYILHIALVLIVSSLLLIYPRFESHLFRALMISIGSIYLYAIFLLYPDTLSNYIFLLIIPIFTILFFDAKLFYFSLFLNFLLLSLTYLYIVFFDHQNHFVHLKMDLSGNMINYLSIQGVIFLLFYVTDIRIKKKKLYYEQIQQLERLKTTGELTAAVAHEIRNPLTVVKGFLQYYENDKTFSDDVRRNFSLMHNELKTAEQILSQFLQLAKPDTEKKIETINIKEVLQSVADLINSYGIVQDNRIVLNIEGDCFISVNPVEFKQLFINFIKNAIEASNKGDVVYVNAKRKGDAVEIMVIDEGNGMTHDELKSLGTPFYSLKSKGTGLGLMICFNIVKSYNGTLDFASTKGEGTTVTVRFPFHAPKS